MKKQDRDYYRGRAEAEEGAARSAVHPQAARSHRQLADEYAKLLADAEKDDPDTAGGPAQA